jgi:hypothetical protein
MDLRDIEVYWIHLIQYRSWWYSSEHTSGSIKVREFLDSWLVMKDCCMELVKFIVL